MGRWASGCGANTMAEERLVRARSRSSVIRSAVAEGGGPDGGGALSETATEAGTPPSGGVAEGSAETRSARPPSSCEVQLTLGQASNQRPTVWMNAGRAEATTTGSDASPRNMTHARSSTASASRGADARISRRPVVS